MHTDATCLQTKHDICCLFCCRITASEVAYQSSSLLLLRLCESLLEVLHAVDFVPRIRVVVG